MNGLFQRIGTGNVPQNKSAPQTVPVSPVATGLTEQGISEHEPRKGTETIKNLNRKDIVFISFQNMNPARGRKFFILVSSLEIETVISEHEPRKGTETA